MNFNNIEELSEERVLSLYSDVVDSGVHKAECACTTSDGYANWGLYRDIGCSFLKNNNITSTNNCINWCRNAGYTFLWFTESCFCDIWNKEAGTYWGYLDRCHYYGGY